MTIYEVKQKFNLPDSMVVIQQDFVNTIIINRGEYLMFYRNSVTYLNKSITMGPVGEDDIRRILNNSIELKKLRRKNKLEKINGKKKN